MRVLSNVFTHKEKLKFRGKRDVNWWEKLKGESKCSLATEPSYGSGLSVSIAHQSVPSGDNAGPLNLVI